MKHLRFLCFLLVLCAAAPVAAQVDRAMLTGVVRDPSNAVIPAATVKMTSLSTGVEQTATATGDGVYVVVNLSPGEYVVEATATGFPTFAQTVQLQTAQRARLDISSSRW